MTRGNDWGPRQVKLARRPVDVAASAGSEIFSRDFVFWGYERPACGCMLAALPRGNPRMSASVGQAVEQHQPGITRWLQLVFGIICMSMIANLQYGWTLFVNPIEDKFHWGIPAIQVAFTIFVVVETWLVPVEGYIVDRFGPKLVGVCSGILVAAAWAINAYASSVQMLYLGSVIGGVGAGGVYGACVGNSLKWFPDRRGLAAGLTAMGFGAGELPTHAPYTPPAPT